MVDKSFTALPRFISEGILGNLVGTSPPTSGSIAAPSGISRGFELFIQSIRKAKNKYDESQIVKRELQTLQTNLSQPNISMVQMKDFLCRMIYCNMLGYDVTFGLIHAVKLAQQGSHIDKKTGYLACCLLMHRDHELILLLVNTIQKDLKSSNILDNLAGLSACSQLVPVEMIPSVLPIVLDKLKHSRELVRQKAVMCLHQFQSLAPDLLEHNQNDLLKMLFDKDPGVMAAAVNIVQNYIQRNPEKCESFGETLMSILKQISSHKMATMFEYHTVPFPWLQIQIIRCLARLASVHKSLSASMVPLFKEILQKTGIKEPIAISIMYECIKGILCMNPPKPLLNETAQHIQRFLVSSHPNLKYIGVKLLVSLVQVNAEYSVNYQQLIVQSLENPDLNVQKKMHRLLFEIANDTNVSVVCAKLLNQLQTSTDKFWRSEVITMVISEVERFDKDMHWQIETVFTCLQSGHDVIKDHTLNTVMNVLEKKFILSGADQRGQKLLVQKCVGNLVSKNLSGVALHISAWVLGELCFLLKNMPDDKVISLFTHHLNSEKLGYPIQSSIVTALQNLVIKGVVNCDSMATKIKECLKIELPVVIKQRLSVILGVCEHGLTLSYHDNFDTTLTFLDDMVTDDLEQGGNPYVPPHLRGVTQETDVSSSVISEKSKSEEASSGGRPRTESTSSSTKTVEESDSRLRLPGVKRVWGKQGRIDTQSKVTVDLTSTTSAVSEEEQRQQELASALFDGFRSKLQTTDDSEQEDEGDSGFLPHSVDTAGWRQIHSSVVSTKIPERQKSHTDLCNSKDSEHGTDVVQQASVSDKLISLDSGTSETDFPVTEPQSIYSEMQMFEGSENSFNDTEGSLGIEDNSVAKNVKDKTAEIDTDAVDDDNLDLAISMLLDNCDIKQGHNPSEDIQGSKPQLGSTEFFSKQFTQESTDTLYRDDIAGLDSVTSRSDSIDKNSEDGSNGANLVETIYQDGETGQENDQPVLDSNKNQSIYSQES